MRRPGLLLGALALAASVLPNAPAAAANPLVLQRTLGGPGHATEYPSGLELAADGSSLVVADTGNNQIVKYLHNVDGTFSEVWKVGVFGTGVPSVAKPQPQFNNPRDVGIDGAGNVFVADTVNQRIVKLDGANGKWLGSYRGPAGDVIGSPMGVTVGKVGGVDRVLVSDAQKKLLRIYDTGLSTQTQKFGQPADARCTFSQFRDAAVDSAGNFYLANYTINTIVILSPSGACLGNWGSKNTSTTGPTQGKFKNPYGVAIGNDPSLPGSPEVIYVASSNDNVIQEFRLDANKTFVRFIGANDAGYFSPGKFSTLRRVAVTAATGFVCGADLWGFRINCYNGSTFDRTVPASPLPPPGYAGRAFTATTVFNEPRGIAFDASNNLYVADAVNQRMVRMTSAGAVTGDCGGRGEEPTSFNWPRGAAFDTSTGRAWVGDTKQSRFQVIAAPFENCAKTAYGSGQFNWVPSLAIRDSDKTAWIVDWKNSRIQVWDASATPPTLLRTYGSRGTGQGQFNQPRGIGIAPNGDVWVADTNNNRVVRLTTTGTTVNSFTSFTGPAGTLKLPEGVDADGTNVYVADTGPAHDRLVVFTISAGASAAPSQVVTGFLRPANVAVNDNTGEVFVADTYNDQIKVYS